PLPFLDDLAVSLKNALADAGKSFAAPVRESRDQLVNALRWIHFESLRLDFCLQCSCDQGSRVAILSVPRKEQPFRSGDRYRRLAQQCGAGRAAPGPRPVSNAPADFNPSAPKPAQAPQGTVATRTWRPGRPAADRAGSPTVPCVGGSRSW